MSPFLRKVRTSSGATAVQIAVKEDSVRRIVEHLGSAHNKIELAALLEVGRQKIAAWQGQGLLDLESLEPAPGRTGLATTTVESKHSRLLWEVLHSAYQRLGLGDATGGDRAFEQMVLARLVEPSSKAQVPRVLGDLGLESVTVRTLFRSLARAQERGYRESLSNALFEHVTNTSGLALCLYDVTTLYFEAEREDDLPVDRAGFPLQVGCWEANKAETTTIVPIVEAFQAAHGIAELVVVAGRRHALGGQPDGPGRRPAAVHRLGPAPPGPSGDLEAHLHWHGDAPADGQVIDTITPKRGSRSERDKSRKAEPVWDPHTHPGSWRAIWVYSRKRAARDNQTLTAQANRARAIRRRPEASQGHAFCHRPSRRTGP